MRGALNPLASNELLGCPWLAPRNLRLPNISQEPPKQRPRRTKHSSGNCTCNITTIQVSFRFNQARFDFASERPKFELTRRRSTALRTSCRWQSRWFRSRPTNCYPALHCNALRK